jgi:hypothetical protein
MTRKGLIGRSFNRALRRMCSGRDLNPQAFRHTPLKRTCLPVPPPERREGGIFRRRQRLASTECILLSRVHVALVIET